VRVLDRVKNLYRNTSQAVKYDAHEGFVIDGNPIYPYPLPGQEQVSTVEAYQTFQLEETGLWQPLGPVAENRWSYTLPSWDFVQSASNPGQITVESVYELPEFLAMGGLPSSIYVFFSVTTGSAELTSTSDWQCEFNFGELFETGKILSPTYLVTEYFACFAAKFTGRFLPVFKEPPRISVKVNGYYSGDGGFETNKRFMNFSLDGSAFELA